MRKLILMLVLCLAPIAVSAQATSNLPYLAVQGQAERTLVPDVFPVAITISETSTVPASAQALVERLAKEVLAAATKVGVQEADITVGNLRISPQMEWDEKTEKNIFKGNLYERVFEIKLRKLDSLRGLAAALPEGRNLRIQTQAFERSDADAIRRQLRADAVKDAKAQAEDLAASAGVRLGKLQNVSDRPQGWNYSMPLARSLDMVQVSGNGSNSLSSEMIVKEGQITLRADAYLVYLISD